MKRFVGVCAAIVFALSMTGCNTMGRQPKLQDATINPTTLKPGDSATITSHGFYQRMVEYFESIGAYHSVWEE